MDDHAMRDKREDFLRSLPPPHPPPGGAETPSEEREMDFIEEINVSDV